VTLPWLPVHPPLLGPAVLQPQEIRELTAPLVRDGRIADWTTGWGPTRWPTSCPTSGSGRPC
jgi:hypothetical protein